MSKSKNIKAEDKIRITKAYTQGRIGLSEAAKQVGVVADAACFTQRTDGAAPGIKQALAFALGHPGFLADGFQSLPFVNSLGKCIHDQLSKVCLAVSADIGIRFQGIHRAEKSFAAFMEEQRKIVHGEQMHGTPVRPALYQTVGVDFIATDGQTVERMTEKLRLHTAEVFHNGLGN